MASWVVNNFDISTVSWYTGTVWKTFHKGLPDEDFQLLRGAEVAIYAVTSFEMNLSVAPVLPAEPVEPPYEPPYEPEPYEPPADTPTEPGSFVPGANMRRIVGIVQQRLEEIRKEKAAGRWPPWGWQ
jgi:hypothetical protein